MSTRMEKYNQPETKLEKRTRRNEELYETISLNQKELDTFKPKSNTEVLGENTNNISIEKIQEILNKKYNEAPKRKSIQIDELDISEPKKTASQETREYDINSILDKARKKQNVNANYDTDRLKKLRDTQYTILEKLDLELEKKEEKKETSNDIMELMNTITAKEKADLDPLDILHELKGKDDTQVIPAIDKKIETFTMPTHDTTQIIKPIEVPKKTSETEKIDTSFYTASNSFTQSDFDDFNSLKEDVKSNRLLTKILIGLIILVLLFGLFILLNGIFSWF